MLRADWLGPIRKSDPPSPFHNLSFCESGRGPIIVSANAVFGRIIWGSKDAKPPQARTPQQGQSLAWGFFARLFLLVLEILLCRAHVRRPSRSSSTLWRNFIET
jgi:hypothetical protein